MPADVEAHQFLFIGQLLGHRPVFLNHRIFHPLPGGRRSLERVEKGNLTPGFVRRVGRGASHRTIDLVEHGGAIGPDGIAGTRLDEGLEGFAVNGLGFHPATQVFQVYESTSQKTSREQRFDRGLTDSLDGRQTEADNPPSFLGCGGGKVKTRGIDVRTQGLDAQGLGLSDVLTQLGGVALIVGHHRTEELHRVVRLQPGRLIGHDSIGRRMRLVETVAREFL